MPKKKASKTEASEESAEGQVYIRYCSDEELACLMTAEEVSDKWPVDWFEENGFND